VKSAFIQEADLICWSGTTDSENPPDEVRLAAEGDNIAEKTPACGVNAGVVETPGSQALFTSIETWLDILV